MKPIARTSAGALLLLTLPLLGQDVLKNFESRVSEFTLDNGWKFILVERHHAPVASFYTYADVGAVQEVKGITGLAHMFEHMAFKGTEKIGTTNYEEERHALDRVDEAFAALKAEKQKTTGGDAAKIKQLEADLKAAEEGAGKFVVANEFAQAIQRAGGRGLNASTGWDRTDYFYSLPSNSVELWFYLESERFLNPVLREFYKEAGVVREERRMRTDSSPNGRLFDDFMSTAYKAHAYGEPVIGHMSDLESFTRKEAEEFFRKNYGPGNLASVIVGDIEPKALKALAQKYMGRIAARPKPEPLRTVEPPQLAERRILMKAQAQQIMIMGYHRPSILDPDYAVYEAISSLMSEGRSSRLHENLVTKKKVSVYAGGVTGIPGDKYPGLFIFVGAPAPGKTNAELEKEMLAEIERMKNEPVTAEELEGFKNRARADLINLLSSDTGMGGQLAKWQTLTGDWRNLFRFLDKITAVTPADIQRVAKATFTEKNRTVALLEPEQTAKK
jgi:predicted Zn-dependent peptidase